MTKLNSNTAEESPCDLPHQVIRASAGSGKTYTLTTRYLGLLRAGERPDQILATTFTRKAAGEILGRVLTRLANAATKPDEAASLAKGFESHPMLMRAGGAAWNITTTDAQQMLDELARSLHRMSVSTLDSFFNRVVQSFRYELAVPPGATIASMDDPKVEQLRYEAIDALLAEHEPDVLLDLLQRLHHDQTQRRVMEAIDEIVSGLLDIYRQVPDRRVWTAIEVPDPLSNDEVQWVTQALTDLEHDIPQTKAGKPVRYWPDRWEDAVNAVEQGDWLAVIGNALTQRVMAGEESYNKTPIPDRWRDVFTSLGEHAKAKVLESEYQRNLATFELVSAFDRLFSAERDKQKLLLFSDLPDKLARYLPERGMDAMMDIYYRLDASVRHLMLDEFQDTSPLQWSVLRPMAEEVVGHVDRSHSFFCVGDTKQAIYGWRGGCAEIFDQIEQDLQLDPDTRATLATSYRSSQVVLDVVNRVFGNIATSIALQEHKAEVERFQNEFEKHMAAKKLQGHVRLITSLADEAVVESQGTFNNDAEGDDEDAVTVGAHERFVVDYVKALVERHPQASVGVLVSRNSVGETLLELMQRAGLPVSGEGGVYIHADPAVSACLAAMTLADHPQHSAAAFEVLNSPLGAVVGLASVVPSHVATVGQRVREALLDEGYARVLTRWAQAMAPSCSEMNVRRMTQLIELAEQFEPSATLRTKHFVTFVQRTQVDDPSAAAVRVMTVHKAKGLEFDIVVLPELHRMLDYVRNDAVYVLRAKETEPPVAIYRGTKAAVRELYQPMAVAFSQEQCRRLKDNVCGLYVAMTRARFALHMIVKPLLRKKDGTPKAAGWTDCSPATLLRRELVGDEPSFEDGEILYEVGTLDWGGVAASREKTAAIAPAAEPVALVDRLIHETRSMTAGTRGAAMVSPSSLESTGRIDVARLLDAAPPAATQRGSVIHAWFEAVDWLPTTFDREAMFDRARRAVPEVSDAELAGMWTAFERMLAQQAVRDLLAEPNDKSRTDLWRERSFVIAIDDQLMRGTFDRVVLTLNDKGSPVAARIIDFKTDAVADDAAMAERVAFYTPQLRAYKRAIATLTGLSPRGDAITCVLLFVGKGMAVQV